MASKLLQQDGFALLQETGDLILLNDTADPQFSASIVANRLFTHYSTAVRTTEGTSVAVRSITKIVKA